MWSSSSFAAVLVAVSDSPRKQAHESSDTGQGGPCRVRASSTFSAVTRRFIVASTYSVAYGSCNNDDKEDGNEWTYHSFRRTIESGSIHFARRGFVGAQWGRRGGVLLVESLAKRRGKVSLDNAPLVVAIYPPVGALTEPLSGMQRSSALLDADCSPVDDVGTLACWSVLAPSGMLMSSSSARDLIQCWRRW
ncbi:hypothetical protein BDZ89DRAFT_1034430 [Hymenopellis radicata]|nr:hypothetical protein BDZ89DRAFT_1034430 [Hymenopellis radicata]